VKDRPAETVPEPAPAPAPREVRDVPKPPAPEEKAEEPHKPEPSPSETKAPGPEPAPPSEPAEPPEAPKEKPEQVESPDKEKPEAPAEETRTPEDRGWVQAQFRTYPLRRGDRIGFSRQDTPLSHVLMAGQKLRLSAAAETDVTFLASGNVLRVDTTGDGRYDRTVGKNGTQLIFKVRRPRGGTSRYSMFVTRVGKSWFVRSGCITRGTLEGKTLTLVDENNNGCFNDLGVDTVSVGRASARAYLGDVVSVGGKLREIQVDASGESVRFREYRGETGVLDVFQGFEGKARIDSAVVQSETCSFNLATMRREAKVPAGNYRLVRARLSARKRVIDVFGSPDVTVAVRDGARSTLAWGGPLRLDFNYHRSEKLIQIRPEWLRFQGKASEVYVIAEGRHPPAPKIQVRVPGYDHILKETTLGTGVSQNGRSGLPGPAAGG
jgi:hypothetical protein